MLCVEECVTKGCDYMSTENTVVVAVCAIAGLFLACPATPVVQLFRRIFYVPFVRPKLLQKAIARGHVVIGRLLRNNEMLNGSVGYMMISVGKNVGVYHYEYNGRFYKYVASGHNLPGEVEMYFENDPSKACPSAELGNREGAGFTCFIIAFVISTLFVYVFCGDFIRSL